jgi:hypothetical protein
MRAICLLALTSTVSATIEHAQRRIRILGATPHPTKAHRDERPFITSKGGYDRDDECFFDLPHWT